MNAVNGTQWLRQRGLKPMAETAMTSAPVPLTEPTVSTAKPTAKPAKQSVALHTPTARSATTRQIETRLQATLALHAENLVNVARLKREWLESRARDLTPEDAATARTMALGHAQAIADAWDAHYATLTRLDNEYHEALSKIGC